MDQMFQETVSDMQAQINQAYRDGMSAGLEIAREMLCRAVQVEKPSFGQALGHIEATLIDYRVHNQRLQSVINELRERLDERGVES